MFGKIITWELVDVYIILVEVVSLSFMYKVVKEYVM